MKNCIGFFSPFVLRKDGEILLEGDGVSVTLHQIVVEGAEAGSFDHEDGEADHVGISVNEDREVLVSRSVGSLTQVTRFPDLKTWVEKASRGELRFDPGYFGGKEREIALMADRFSHCPICKDSFGSFGAGRVQELKEELKNWERVMLTCSCGRGNEHCRKLFKEKGEVQMVFTQIQEGDTSATLVADVDPEFLSWELIFD